MSEPRTVSERITDYLASGGLFNPELANHDAVRDLLIDARDELAAEKASRAALLAGRPDVAAIIGMLEGYIANALPGIDTEIMRRSRATLESLAAQLAEKEQESEDDDKLRSKMDDILTRTANALKGDPAPNRLHDWSDLPFLAELSVELAKQATEKLAASREEVKRLREHAEAIASCRIQEPGSGDVDAVKFNAAYLAYRRDYPKEPTR